MGGETSLDTSGRAARQRSKARSYAFSALLLALSVAIIWLLWRYGLVDFDSLLQAYRHQYLLLALAALCVLATSIVGILRHLWALSVLNVKVPKVSVVAANIIGQAIAIWAPGNIAVMEGLRMGLLVRPLRSADDVAQATSRMAMASIFDRTTSLAALFLTGAAGALYPYLARPEGFRGSYLLIGLGVAYVILGAVLLCAPQIASTGLFVWIAARLDGAKQAPHPLAKRAAGMLRHMHDAAAHWRAHKNATLVTGALAAVIAILFSLTMWIASVAVGSPVPLWLATALFPSSIIAAIFPIGFAGLGGPQLLAIAVYAPFGVDARTVATMTLLQSTVTVAVQTMLGLVWAAVRHEDITYALGGSSGGRPEGN